MRPTSSRCWGWAAGGIPRTGWPVFELRFARPDQTAAVGSGGGRRAARVSLGSAVAVSLVVSGLLIWRSRFELNGGQYYGLFDDALISMRFARNLAGGQGLVWNVGQAPVEGYTNFLWTVWMAVL